jgi:hypothetical protein
VIDVGEVGSEKQSIFAEQIDHVFEPGLGRIAADVTLSPDVVGRLHAHAVGDLPPELAVFHVEARQPVRHPAGAGLEKRNAQAGMPLEHSRFDERQHRHHLLQRMGAGMPGKSAAETVAADCFEAAVGSFVDSHGDVEPLALRPERLVGGISQRTPGQAIRPDGDGGPAPGGDPSQLGHHVGWIVARERADRPQQRRIRGTELAQPVVVGAHQRRSERRIHSLDRKHPEAHGRIQVGPFDAHPAKGARARRAVEPRQRRVGVMLEVVRCAPRPQPVGNGLEDGVAVDRQLPKAVPGARAWRSFSPFGIEVLRPELVRLDHVGIGIDDPHAVLYPLRPV